jgi:DNA polymerase elongation subunit (family B)
LDVNIQFFNTEVELVKWFFHIVNEIDRPDIMMAWNIRFDFVTISNRLTKLGYEPASIICPLEFQSYRNSYYYTDMRAKDIAEKKDYIEVNGYTQYSDQMINFAKLRVGTKYESYSLDAIAQATIGASKVDLQGYSIKDVAYKDYKLFMKYAMVDTFRLSQIEDKEEDVDMLYALSIITMTRINKVLTKTTSLRNLAAKFFFDQGYIIGNNPNINRMEMNKKISAKFRGALTLQVLLKVS